MKKKLISYSVGFVLLFLIFVWVHMLVHTKSFSVSGRSDTYLILAVASVLLTSIYYWCFVQLIDMREETDGINISRCLNGTLILAFSLFGAFILEINWSGFSLFGDSEIRFGTLCFSKSYLYYIVALVLFPIGIEWIFKGMRSEKFSQKSVLGGAILIAVMSAAEFFCFAVMGNMCLINLAVLNTAVLAAAVYKYIFGGRKIKRRIAIKATSL